MRNIPVQLDIDLRLTVDGQVVAEIPTQGGFGVVCPTEHPDARSFIADCEHTIRRWLAETAEAMDEELVTTLSRAIASGVLVVAKSH